VLLAAGAAFARPANQVHEFSEPSSDRYLVGNLHGTLAPQKVLQDTTWIADWSFESGGNCVDAGWAHIDNHITNDGSLWWDVVADFDATGGISGNAAALGYQNDPCCEELDGYDNDWYQAIKILYNGAGDLSLDYLVDSEGGFDFFQVEEDSACASADRVDFSVDPSANAAAFRNVLFSDSGFNLAGSVVNQAVTDYGIESCLYIGFFADGAFAPCDGLQATVIGRAIVVDNIVFTDGNGSRSDDFTSGSISIGTFENIADDIPFGTWARTYKHITDNDVCTENTTCAWLWTDDGSFDGNPTFANDPSMAFAPDGQVIRNWLDDIIVSPWVSLSTTPSAVGTIITFRRFPGNFFSTSRAVQNWSVRGKTTTPTACVSGWGHSGQWNSLSFFGWQSLRFDMAPYFDPTSEDVQIRHRASDWQWIVGASPPNPFIPGPGPYTDRTRIGRQILTGPVLNEGIDARSQAQDAFATIPFMLSGPPTQEVWQPDTDRFGTVAFSRGTELGTNNTSPNLITGDSIHIEVVDVRGAGGITSIDLLGAIVAGPHAGKAPAPYTVGANGFFTIAADSARNSSGAVINENWYVDIDDTYLRGGDELVYFWAATDAQGGFTSDPVGLTGLPADVAEAQEATQGMLTMSALPTINWSQSYLDRIAADPHGDLEPTDPELAESSQANCILYTQFLSSRRRSGDVNRTSFMYTLDALGYRGSYDVYDHQGLGNTNNQVGGRATIQQAEGYNLIVYDTGNSASTFVVPDGTDLDAQKIDQLTWFRNWLAQATSSEAGFATLWMMGSNFVQTKNTNPLYVSEMGIAFNSADQALAANPDVVGEASFTFDQGIGSVAVNFTGDEYSLSGGCPVIRNYDGYGSSGSAVETHRYRDPLSGATGDAGIVMNSNPALDWNTIGQSHPWFDIEDVFCDPLTQVCPPPNPQAPSKNLMAKILGGALPVLCQQPLDPTDTGQPDEIDAPRQTSLAQNVPNPFNPMTRIEFDLARDGQVSLKIYDVAGRLVRTLIDAPLTRGRYTGENAAVWDGFNNSGQRVSSGVYFYRLNALDFVATKKMVMMK
jgi:hypothetical protein